VARGRKLDKCNGIWGDWFPSYSIRPLNRLRSMKPVECFLSCGLSSGPLSSVCECVRVREKDPLHTKKRKRTKKPKQRAQRVAQCPELGFPVLHFQSSDNRESGCSRVVSLFSLFPSLFSFAFSPILPHGRCVLLCCVSSIPCTQCTRPCVCASVFDGTIRCGTRFHFFHIFFLLVLTAGSCAKQKLTTVADATDCSAIFLFLSLFFR